MTIGISPKAKLAALLPALGAVLTILIQFAVTGDLDQNELVTALVGFMTAVLAFTGAYLGDPGEVIPAPVGPGSDARLSSEALEHLDE